MARALELEAAYTVVSGYELGTREPSLVVLLRYARLARVPVDYLLDDELDLPKMPIASGTYEWVLRKKK
jgi:transcriptional regulator with XRE-family HTH domain